AAGGRRIRGGDGGGNAGARTDAGGGSRVAGGLPLRTPEGGADRGGEGRFGAGGRGAAAARARAGAPRTGYHPEGSEGTRMNDTPGEEARHAASDDFKAYLARDIARAIRHEARFGERSVERAAERGAGFRRLLAIAASIVLAL